MLVDFPFLPETQDTVDQWRKNLEEGNISDEEIAKMDLSVNFNIPQNLSTEESGQDDNAGLYYPKLLSSYQSVKMKDGCKIDAYFNFLPVILTENKIDQDHEYSQGELDQDMCVDVYKVQEELLMPTYGFTLTVADFMSLIGNQLKASKRKFCVAFHLVKYHDDVFHKSGRLYHHDHTKITLKDEEEFISFHVFELIDENDYDMPRNLQLNFMSTIFRADTMAKAVVMVDNVHNQEFIDKLKLKADN